jgi:flagellar biosynthesis/type III secretory pathway protein FliH
LQVVEEKMKSFSKIHSSASDLNLESWNVADLDIASNVYPPAVETEQIMMLFGTGEESQASQPDRKSRLSFHPKGLDVELANWLPGDLDQQIKDDGPQQWEFVEPSSNDSPNVSEQQIFQDKLEVEKERVELIRLAQAEAEEILHSSHLEADKIISRAQDEIEQAKKDAYQAAYEEMQSALAATRTVVEETHQWQASFLESGEQILVGMLKDIAQTMFGEGVHLDANALQINLNRFMESAQRLGDLNIFLNPQDANLLDPSWSDYQLLITGNKVRVVPSEKILPGGCFIKGNTGAVDARVETQLASVLNTIDEISETGR